MIRTTLSHTSSCSQQKVVRQLPPAAGVGRRLFECSECGATATSKQQSADR